MRRLALGLIGLLGCAPVTLRSGGEPLLLDNARLVPPDVPVLLPRGPHRVERIGKCSTGELRFVVDGEATVQVPAETVYAAVQVLALGPDGAEVAGAVERDGQVLGATGEWLELPVCTEQLTVRSTAQELGELPLQPLVDADATYFVRLAAGEELRLEVDAESDDAMVVRPKLVYPDWAQQLGVEGVVLLEYVVTPQGETVPRDDERCPGSLVTQEPGASLWDPEWCIEARAGRLDLVPETLAVAPGGRWAPWPEAAKDGAFSARLRVVYELLDVR